jgi:ABC-2 type transport system permease protein
MEVTNVPIGVLNEDWGQASRQLVSRLEHTTAFSEILVFRDLAAVREAIDGQRVMAVLHLGQTFSRDLESGRPAVVQLLLDGRKSNAAQLVSGYVGTIVNDFALERREAEAAAPPVSAVVDRTWFNPNRDYRMAMVPSLLGTLTMATVLIVVALSVARERELGTFEQLLVSPLQPLEIVVGKTIPGLLIGLVQGSAIIAVVVAVFGIPVTGSVGMLYLGLFVFLLAITGVALFISSLAATQQQAMLGAMVFMMPAMLLSGFATPVGNMPDWLQPVALANPLTHFLVIVRGVFLREMSAGLVAERIWPMALLAILALLAAAWMFKRRTE